MISSRLETTADAARLAFDLKDVELELMTNTDGLTVKPLEFPGGNIGSLAIHGTVNDLAASGATPLDLTLNAFIKEGKVIALLEPILAGMAVACCEAQAISAGWANGFIVCPRETESQTPTNGGRAKTLVHTTRLMTSLTLTHYA